jgi:hypothetical protein
MKRAEVFFHPMDGSGQLSITWSSLPKGAAIEAKRGNGVGFFSTKGDLLSVIFDDVLSEKDHQVLEFKEYKVEISVMQGIVKHKLIRLTRPKIARKTRRSTLKNRRSKVKR